VRVVLAREPFLFPFVERVVAAWSARLVDDLDLLVDTRDRASPYAYERPPECVIRHFEREAKDIPPSNWVVPGELEVVAEPVDVLEVRVASQPGEEPVAVCRSSVAES